MVTQLFHPRLTRNPHCSPAFLAGWLKGTLWPAIVAEGCASIVGTLSSTPTEQTPIRVYHWAIAAGGW